MAAPFVFGLLAVAGYTFLGTSSRNVFWGCIVVLAIAASIASYFGFKAPMRSKPFRVAGGALTLTVFTLSLCFALLTATAYTPFYSNDALEYATVAKELSISGNLAIYPLIAPDSLASGFYGPWTHPPLYPVLLSVLSFSADGSPTLLSKLTNFWFAIATAILLFAIVAKSHPIKALLAVFLLFSTPLYFESVSSSLIDALPVAGLLLIFAAQSIGGTSFHRGLLSGISLGLALWSHSQAILFIPFLAVLIVAHYGLRRIKVALIEFAYALAIAMPVACAPYLKNLKVFGSLISDNPTVFALPSLMWSDYFAISRGINTLIAALQYGLLKGWFMISSFGWIFWLATVGAIAIVWTERKNYFSVLAEGTEGRPCAVELKSIVLILTYLAGCLVSIIAGNDLMIKNERYLLMLVPFAAILAAAISFQLGSALVVAIFDERRMPWKRELCALALASLTFFVLIRPSLMQIGWLRFIPAILGNECDKAPFCGATPENISSMLWVDTNLPGNAVILAMRPADLLYSGRRMISYLDPRLLAVYEASKSGEALRILRDLGVTHVQFPDYYMPPIYNSVVEQLLADPSSTSLIHDSMGHQIYALLPETFAVSSANQIDFVDWERVQGTDIPTFRRWAGLDLLGSKYVVGSTSVGESPFGLFERSFKTVVTSEFVDKGSAPHDQWLLKMKIGGHGSFRVWVNIEGFRSVRVADLFLGDRKPNHVLARRFSIPADRRRFSIVIEHFGNSSLVLDEATVVGL